MIFDAFLPFKKRRLPLPGKTINLVFSLTYLTCIVILPLVFLVLSIHHISFKEFSQIVLSERALHAFQISFSLSLFAAIIDLFLGVVVAWVLVKYDFFCKKFFDSIVDLPFAMPTAVSGISLAVLYSDHGWIGQFLHPLGLTVSFTQIGIVIALIFIGLPFVVRTVQPAIISLDQGMEEAAISLGAGRTAILRRIILPQLLPSIITGFTMAFARGLGEYGSVIFIAGNIPYATEILPLLIVIELDQFNYKAATVLAISMLAASLLLLVILGFIGRIIRKRLG